VIVCLSGHQARAWEFSAVGYLNGLRCGARRAERIEECDSGGRKVVARARVARGSRAERTGHGDGVVELRHVQARRPRGGAAGGLRELSMSAPPLTVAVFAHDEERRIAACLDSILAAEPGRRCDVYVLANGCADRTEEIAGGVPAAASRNTPDLDRSRRQMQRVERLGARDGAVALPGTGVLFFMDGDARVVPGSLTAMERALRRQPSAHAASAGRPRGATRTVPVGTSSANMGCRGTCTRCAAVSSSACMPGRCVCRSTWKATMR
jgi:hypothetical protein